MGIKLTYTGTYRMGKKGKVEYCEAYELVTPLGTLEVYARDLIYLHQVIGQIMPRLESVSEEKEEL